MTQLIDALGWLFVVVGTLITGYLLYTLGYALLVPDTSGSPDARGMVFGLSVVGLVTGIAFLAFGGFLVSYAKRR